MPPIGSPGFTRARLTHGQPQELEEFGRLYSKYTRLCETYGEILRQDALEMRAAYARACAELLAEQAGNPPASARNPDEIREILRELARRCEIVPKSFKDCWHIIFSAMNYVRIMLDCVVAASDLGAVMRIGTRLLREARASPTQVTFVPTKPATRRVTGNDLDYWRAHPEFLVGKEFITAASKTFIVSDFAVKMIKGAQYDIHYKEYGQDDVQVINQDKLLELVANGSLITTDTTFS